MLSRDLVERGRATIVELASECAAGGRMPHLMLLTSPFYEAVKSQRPAGASFGEEMRGREWKSKRQMIFVSSLALSFIVWTAAVLAQTGSGAKSSDPPDEPGKAPEVTCAGVAVFSAVVDQRCTSYAEACWTSATHWHPQRTYRLRLFLRSQSGGS